ncbi:MAG TPA: amino acid ABC transporter permease [Acidimicrobiales bacterium]|nr:amino acid ABC transporter permease [Acidimicrobiales bacterium]
MTASASFLGDAPGPRGRRRAAIASVAAAVALVGLGTLIVKRLADRGQLAGRQWEPFTRESVVRFLLGGLGNTVKAAAVAMVLAIVVGATLALARLSRRAAVRWVATAWVEFFRGVPLILLILFTRFGLIKYDIDLSVFWALVIALVAYNGAVFGELFRAGILSLDRGQGEAASAIGLTYGQSMASVIVPQAARRMIPALVSQSVTLLKDTSLGFVIGFDELLRRSRVTGEFFFNPLQALAMAAALYIAVNFTLSRLARRLEVRQRRRYKAGSIEVGGIEDLAVMAAQSRTVR